MINLSEDMNNAKLGDEAPKRRRLSDVINSTHETYKDNIKEAPYAQQPTSVRLLKGFGDNMRQILYTPQGLEIMYGQAKMTIGDVLGNKKIIERGKSLIQSANEEITQAEIEAERNGFAFSPEDYKSFSYALGGGAANYGVMLATAYATGGLTKAFTATQKAAGIATEASGLTSNFLLEAVGKNQKALERYKQETGDVELKNYNTQEGKKALATSLIYGTGSTILEKYMGFSQQRKMFAKPTEMFTQTAKIAASEGTTEFSQSLLEIGIDLSTGTINWNDMPEQLREAFLEGAVGAVLGGGAGIASSISQRAKTKNLIKDFVKGTVSEEKKDIIVNEIYEDGNAQISNIIAKELKYDTELRNKRGDIYYAMIGAVAKEMEGKPRFERMTEDERAHYANTVAEHFANNVLAEANFRNVTIDDVLRGSDIRYDKGLKIARHINLYDALKNPEMIPAETKLRKKGTSLIQFLRNSGGIQDEGGNLKSRDVQKQYIGLINKNGMTLDDAALLAWQEGYLPDADYNYGRPDINALLDAIDEGLRGNHRYNVVEDETRTFKDALEDLKEQLNDMGIDWQNMTAAEIEKAVNEIPEKESLEREYEFYENYEPEIGMSEDEAERFAIETEGKEYPVIDDKDLPFYYQLADEITQLDAENPAYEGETITINGQEKTVYNSNGDRIAKSKEALENFYKWFGDSKVVDEQGRPLVVYHGTKQGDFSVFDKSKIGSQTDYGYHGIGFYLTPQIDLAESYSKDWQKYRLVFNPKGRIMPLYSKIENPYVMGTEEARKFKTKSESQSFTNKLKEAGYDGILVEIDELVREREGELEEVIVFEPNQIKSTSNRGTYSESENIYYQWEDIGSKTRFSKSKSDLKKLLSIFPPRGDYRLMYDADKRYWFVTDSMELIHQDILKQAWRSGLYPEFSREWEVQNFFDEKTYEDDTLYRFVAQGYENNNYMEKIENMGDDYTTAYVVPTKDGNGVVIFARGLGELADAGIGYLEENAKIYDVQTKEEIKPETYYQSAFAGSPVDYDRPSLEAIGSGEGAQVHGWGLYYALDREVAEGYRERSYASREGQREHSLNADFETLMVNGKPLLDVYNIDMDRSLYNDLLYKPYGTVEAEIEDRIAGWEDRANDPDYSFKDYAKEKIDAYKRLKEDLFNNGMSLIKKDYGQVHEVDIPENPYLLDEDTTYFAQPEIVRNALDEVINNLTDEQISKEFEGTVYPENRDALRRMWKTGDYDFRNEGGDIYKSLSKMLGSPKAASQMLEKYGIKGITYYGQQDGRCFVIFNPADVKVIQKFYQGEEAPKGYTDITPDEYIIKLLEGADESTLPHELAHYWLNEMWNYTRTGRASENYMKRWQIISDYLGITPEQNRLTPTQQEKFASSYEAYLTRGELPTPLIGSVFDDYDKWLQRVYNDYNSINYHVRKGKKIYSHPIRLTDAAIKFFQSMTTGTLEPPALAPKNTGVTIPQEIEMPEVAEPTNEIVETPTTYDTTRVINITEGEKGVSKVFKREAMKHADRIVDELGVSYNKINLEEQAVKAAEWVQNNLEEARKVVNGAAAPEGIIDTAIFIAYENEMLRIGNNAEYQRALKIHSQVQTQRGQAIAAERITTDDVYNPAYWWKKLQKSKETQVAQQLFKGDVKALNEMIETETKSIMKEIAGKPKEEQIKALSELAEKLQKDYNLETLYQMPDEVNERTVKEFIKDTIGVNPDVMAGNEVINKAEQLQKLWENTKDKSGNPSVEAMRAKRELNDLIQAQTPSNKLAIWTSIFGRGIMLTSVKSPVLNIISNIEAGFTEGITRRLMYGTTEKAVDKTVKNEFSKYAWEVYKASSDIVTTMNDYDDDMRIIGEQILHSQGEGLLRAASRKVEEVSFKYLMGAPDAVAKTFAFNDTADLLATKIAREEGAADISKRATEIYKDAILIKPETEQGQLVRKQAQEQAHYTTFTNDSWAAKFGLSARNWLNMVGKNKVRLGDLTMKFVKTPANVQMMGLEYGFGSLYALYNVQEIIKNPQSETSKIAIKAAVRNGLGIALAALLYSMLDPDDYFSEFDTLNPKEKDRMKAMGAMPNSIKIGNRWVSLDYFGQLGIPLVGMLEARRNNGLRSYIQSGLTQAAKIPGIKETKQLIDSMSEYARYDLKPEKIAQMMAGTVLDQARAMTIPAIVNDIAKMTDDYERDTMGGVMDKVIASIPGLRQTLPERYGIQGLVRTEPAVSTLLFGSRVKTAQEDKLVREVEKLAKKDEQPSISDVTKYGDLRLLSPEKKVKVRKEFYQLYNSESKKLISTREYQKKTPDDKKKALNKVRSRVVKSLKEKYSNDIQREKRRQ